MLSERVNQKANGRSICPARLESGYGNSSAKPREFTTRI
jgi:hypothetical protein